MTSTLGKAKTRPRRIGQDLDEDEDVRMGDGDGDREGNLLTMRHCAHMSDKDGSGLTACVESTTAFNRPNLSSRTSSKAKKNRSSLRTSFNPGGTSMNEEDEEPTAVFVPKKSNLSRQALERNTLKKSHPNPIPTDRIPLRQADDRPTYSTDSLNELRSSTPATPKELANKSDIQSESRQELDLAAKFGSNLESYKDSAIPSNAEIREKKERRARLAKEQDFIGLDAEGDLGTDEGPQGSDEENSLLPYAESKPSKNEDSRLVRDDEDIAEGFDGFVDDGRIALGRKAQKEQKKRQADEMRAMIEQAEGQDGTDESSLDESEVERRAAYEAAQTRAGMDGMKRQDRGAKPRRPRTPPKITPLPTLAGCAEKIEADLAQKQYAKAQKVQRLEEVEKELTDIAARKVDLQRLLDEAAENYQRLRAEAGLGAIEGANKTLLENGNIDSSEESRDTHQGVVPGMGLGMASRGLENLGEST